ncbi:MAG TPA: DegQ family serine endoprotease [Bacteroidota bacterium]|nr:DegQ family serine endoprotease [Bacteroidota bacterium]
MAANIRTRWILAASLAAGFVGAGAFFMTVGAAPQSHQSLASGVVAPEVTPQGKELLNQFSTAFESAAAKVNPAVVPIMSEQVTHTTNPFGSSTDPLRDFFGDDFFRRFFNTPQGDQKQVVHALGSGVIVSKEGYILTNNHVVDGADKLTVVLQDKQKYTAKVVGRDPQTDVAVIKIDAKDLPVAELGNSDQARVGQWVIAVGNPFQLMHTVTAGIISAKGRSSVNLADYEDFIQTDASINPGNSGGALADLDGNVIGINTAIFSPSGAGGNVGIGFAIPINMAKSVMHQLVTKGKVTRGFLGLLPQDIDEGLARAMHLKDTKGCLVGDVNPDGPADKAGIRHGDVITTFNGVPVENAVQLRNLVAEAEPGSKASVGVLRDGSAKEFTVELGERPKNLAAANGKESAPEERSAEKFGLSVQDLTPAVAQALGYKNDKGVIVASVKPESAAYEAGIQKNDLIKEINREPVSSVSDFRKAMEHVGKNESVALLLKRGNNTFYVALQVAS